MVLGIIMVVLGAALAAMGLGENPRVWIMLILAGAVTSISSAVRSTIKEEDEKWTRK